MRLLNKKNEKGRKPHRTLGLEISDREMKLCEISERNGQQIQVQGSDRMTLPEGAIVDGKIIDAAIVTDALQQLLKTRKRQTNKIHLAVPSNLVMVRMLQLPDVGYADMRKLVQYELQNNMQVAFEDPYYDFVKYSSPDKQLADVLVVVAPQKELYQYIDILEGQRLQPMSIEIKALSLMRVLKHSLTEEQKAGDEGLYMLVDIGRYASEIAIVDGEQLKMTRQMEAYFSDRASTDSEETYREESSARLDLISEMQRMMNFYYYTLNHRERQFDKVWVVSDLPSLQELVKEMQQQIQSEVLQLVLPIEVAGSPSGSAVTGDSQQTDTMHQSAYAVSIGLALRGGE